MKFLELNQLHDAICISHRLFFMFVEQRLFMNDHINSTECLKSIFAQLRLNTIYIHDMVLFCLDFRLNLNVNAIAFFCRGLTTF